MKVTVLFHVFYPDSIRETTTLLRSLDSEETRYIFNVPFQQFLIHKKISAEIKANFPDAIILNTPNKGKDIGGKLAMLNCYLHLNEKSDYLVFLHDKRSELAYTINYKKIDSEIWKKELFSIIHPDNISRVKKLFATGNTGMITHSSHIYSKGEHGEYVIFGNNIMNLENLCSRFGLSNISEKRTDFAGGTMFWIKSSIFEEFFSEHSPLEIRAMLEEGSFTDRYTGTYSHAMERIFSWIVTSKGYSIGGI
jgi:lipopolysaccharide biosynthesis protein